MPRFYWWTQHTGQEFVFLTDCLKCTLSHPKGSLFETDFLGREGLSALRWITVPLEAFLNFMCALSLSSPASTARTEPPARSRCQIRLSMPISTVGFSQIIYRLKSLLFSVQLTSKQCEGMQWVWVEHTNREGLFSLSNTPWPSFVLLAFFSPLLLISLVC